MDWRATTLGENLGVRLQELSPKALRLSQAAALGLTIPPTLVLIPDLSESVTQVIPKIFDWARKFDRHGTSIPPLAIRSACENEDLDHSNAGRYSSVLGVRTRQDTVAALELVLNSMRGFQRNNILIQTLIDSSAAGVAFSLDPRDGDRSCIAIEHRWGFCTGVTRGDPSDFTLIDKGSLETIEKVTNTKQASVIFDTRQGVLTTVPTSPDMVNRHSLSRRTSIKVAQATLQLEKHLNTPVDIEWCLTPDGEKQELVILQLRPETSWTRYQNRGVARTW